MNPSDGESLFQTLPGLPKILPGLLPSENGFFTRLSRLELDCPQSPRIMIVWRCRCACVAVDLANEGPAKGCESSRGVISLLYFNTNCSHITTTISPSRLFLFFPKSDHHWTSAPPGAAEWGLRGVTNSRRQCLGVKERRWNGYPI